VNGLPQLDRLKSESIHIIREVVAECARPVLLYSVGQETMATSLSERQGRVIDRDGPAAMERMKQDGYF
jgi:3'-phosphoadenosine 5'-phosphosulfate sulfotransferase (PAPS reductase)/FAD synthetase